MMKKIFTHTDHGTGRWFCLIGCVIGLAMPWLAGAREFTSTDGKKLNGDVISVSGESVVIRIGTKNFTVPISRFVEVDQKYIGEWKKNADKEKIPRLQVRVNNGSGDRSDRNDSFDNSVGHFRFSVEIENEESGYNLAKGNGTLIVFGEDVGRKDQYVVMQKSEVKVNIPDGEDWKWSGDRVDYRFDDSIPVLWGYKYYGYILVVKNATGKIIYQKAMPKKFERVVEQGLKLGERDLVDKTMKRKGRASSSYF